MRMREAQRVTAPAAAGGPLVTRHQRSRLRAAVGAMFGVPLIVLLAMAALIAFDEHPITVPAQHIELRTEGGGTGTALVLGAGTGIHLLRVSHDGVPVMADLAAGPLRIMSLRTLQLDARGVSGKDVSLRATGHTLRLRSDGAGVMVRTGM